MSEKRVLLVALAVLAIFRVSAVAQDEKNELTGIIGRTFISDQGIIGPNAPPVEAVIYSGKGLSFEANYARRLLVTQIYSISAEVLWPLNGAAGHNIGAIGQFHLYFDDLMPNTLGKPISQW